MFMILCRLSNHSIQGTLEWLDNLECDCIGPAVDLTCSFIYNNGYSLSANAGGC